LPSKEAHQFQVKVRLM